MESCEAVNQVYNVAVGAKTSLNELFSEIRSQLIDKYPNLKNVTPRYGEFRNGDVRHSLADISKSKKLLGFSPTHDIRTGLTQAIRWYHKVKKN